MYKVTQGNEFPAPPFTHSMFVSVGGGSLKWRVIWIGASVVQKQGLVNSSLSNNKPIDSTLWRLSRQLH